MYTTIASYNTKIQSLKQFKNYNLVFKKKKNLTHVHFYLNYISRYMCYSYRLNFTVGKFISKLAVTKL